MTATRPRRGPPSMDGWTLVRLFGIELQIHGSWIFSFALLTFVASNLIVPYVIRDGSSAARFLVSALFALIIAACIVAHELAHSLVARAYGLPVRRITL